MGQTVELTPAKGASGSARKEEEPNVLESLSTEELQFIKAIEKYKSENRKIFLSWTEVLKILKEIGYHKVARKASATKKAPPKRRSRTPKSTPAGKAQAVETKKDAAPGPAETVTTPA